MRFYGGFQRPIHNRTFENPKSTATHSTRRATAGTQSHMIRKGHATRITLTTNSRLCLETGKKVTRKRFTPRRGAGAEDPLELKGCWTRTPRGKKQLAWPHHHPGGIDEIYAASYHGVPIAGHSKQRRGELHPKARTMSKGRRRRARPGEEPPETRGRLSTAEKAVPLKTLKSSLRREGPRDPLKLESCPASLRESGQSENKSALGTPHLWHPHSPETRMPPHCRYCSKPAKTPGKVLHVLYVLSPWGLF